MQAKQPSIFPITLSLAVLLSAAATLPGCNAAQGEEFFGGLLPILDGPQRFSIYWNDPGVSEETAVDKEIDLKLVDVIESAPRTLDMSVYNLGRASVIDALERAQDRGVRVRMVGDVDEAGTNGYRRILRTNIPFSLGNSTAIQHNKFAIADSRLLFFGTGNITDSDLFRNNNNFIVVESPELGAAFTREFEQMYFGRYGAAKFPVNPTRDFVVNTTRIELYFSPYDGTDAMDRLIRMIDGAQREIHFMIFAFTHDEMAAALVRAAKRGVVVRGIHDKTFIRGVSMEAPRLYNASRHLRGFLEVREDGNEFTSIEGVSAHGGKLHTKTIIVDRQIVSTGSFNWSNNAVENNDENMVVIYSPRIAEQLLQQWNDIFAVSRPITGQLNKNAGDIASPGEVVISEVNWTGAYSGTSLDAADDYLELRNIANRSIDVSHWSITWDTREIKLFPLPDGFNWYEDGIATRHYSSDRLIIPPGGYFLIKAINSGAVDFSDVKISGTKDFSLTSASLRIRLYDAAMNLIDEAGDGDPPFAGRLDTGNQVAFSMERFFYPTGHPLQGRALPGASSGSWYTSNGNNLTGAALAGTGEMQSTHRDCTGGAFAQQCTVGTPSYSGNAVGFAPPSNPTGGENNATNIPVFAASTSATTAFVRMRWAMQNAPAIGGGACPCTSALDASDPALVRITTTAQAPGTLYTFTVGAALDVTTGNSVAGSISYTGYQATKANFVVERVYPSRTSSEDIVLLRATSSGSARDLGVYFYDSFAPIPQLLYRVGDIHVNAGEYIQIRLDSPCNAPCGTAALTSEERRLGSSPTINVSANPNGATSETGLAAGTVWELFSPSTGLPGTDAVVFVSYDLNANPVDVMCYSNRDGDMANGLITAGMRDVYRWGPSVYNLGGLFPVDGGNDFAVQSKCSLYTGTAASAYLQRSGDTNSGGDFSCVNC